MFVHEKDRVTWRRAEPSGTSSTYSDMSAYSRGSTSKRYAVLRILSPTKPNTGIVKLCHDHFLLNPFNKLFAVLRCASVVCRVPQKFARMPRWWHWWERRAGIRGEWLCSFTHIISDSLRAGRFGDRIPVGARFSAPVQTGPRAYPASCTMGTGSFPGGKAAGAWRWPPTPI
jgi:hypothetical protein